MDIDARLAQLGVFGVKFNQDAVATQLDADFTGGSATTKGIEHGVAVSDAAMMHGLIRSGGKTAKCSPLPLLSVFTVQTERLLRKPSSCCSGGGN